jgi:hypothetical protein
MVPSDELPGTSVHFGGRKGTEGRAVCDQSTSARSELEARNSLLLSSGIHTGRRVRALTQEGHLHPGSQQKGRTHGS